MHGRVARRKQVFSKENIVAHLHFAKVCAKDKPEGYWKNVLLTEETKLEVFGLNEKHYAW